MEDYDEVRLFEAPVINIDLGKNDGGDTSALMLYSKRFAHWMITADLALRGKPRLVKVSFFCYLMNLMTSLPSKVSVGLADQGVSLLIGFLSPAAFGSPSSSW